MKELLKVFKSLSDQAGQRILNILMERECCVCEAMQALLISQTRASRNLNELYGAGLLKARRNGLWILCSIDQETIEANYPHLLKNISKQLKDNHTIKEDINRLRTAERVGIGCFLKALSSNLN